MLKEVEFLKKDENEKMPSRNLKEPSNKKSTETTVLYEIETSDQFYLFSSKLEL